MARSSPLVTRELLKGLLTWQILRHSRIHQVFVAARKGVREDLARQFRAEELDPTEIDVIAEIKDRTNGVGVDLAVETAAQPETVTMALEATRKLGRVVEVGIFEKPATFELNDLVFQERELIGIINNSGEFPQAIQMMADGRVEGSGGSLRLHDDGAITIQSLGEPERRHEYESSTKGFGGDCVFATQQHFVQCLLSGEEFETSGRAYLRNLDVLEAAYAAGEQRSWISLP